MRKAKSNPYYPVSASKWRRKNALSNSGQNSLCQGQNFSTNFIFLLLFLLLAGANQKNTGNRPKISEKIPGSRVNTERTQKLLKEEIKIGLLLPVPPDNDLISRSAQLGAELAIEQANDKGGYNGQTFKLIIRTADGLWGAGSKESVRMVHEDEVVAIVTAVDGRNAHLAEQVAAKSHVVQVATRATEETLSQAYVPWFFRIVPNDKQQGLALIEEVFENRGLTNIHLMIEDNRNSPFKILGPF